MYLKILSSKKTKILILLLLLIFILAAFFQIKSSDFNTKTEVLSAKAYKIDPSRYEEVKNELFKIVDEENPRAALEKLKISMKEDPEVLASCHELMHDLGGKAYEKYKDFGKTVAYNEDFCVSGFIHGVLEAHFTSDIDIIDALNNTCDNYKQNSYFEWECYHGMGHGLMYYSLNNLPEAIDKCKLIDSFALQSACANGAFMENFNADSKLHPTRYVDAGNPVYPCDTFEDFKYDCYMNAPIYLLSITNYDYEKAIVWCDQVEDKFKDTCYMGFSSQMTRRNMKDTKSILEFCEKQIPVSMDACLSGIVSWYTGFYVGVNEAYGMCSNLPEEYKSSCVAKVNSYISSFN